MCEIEEDDVIDEGINMVRSIKCPYCPNEKIIDLKDYVDDEECIEHGENGMGTETIYRFDFNIECDSCGKEYNINGFISEYPVGAYDSEEINIEEIETDEDE